ncbi:hypothetical protein DH2020_034151 [Rehmannia glutinosa]|uniref:Peptidase A1 domain-containing protein n=1 Tax=Rehmannia glutinosa TaxID=99300 RepID=A0ABR0VE29_REHGL
MKFRCRDLNPGLSGESRDYPLFDPKKSTSYKKLSTNHALARFFTRSNNDECNFNVTYESGQSSSGIASVETFTFPSSKRVPESIQGIVFGCTNNYQGQFASNTLVTGIMGMNRSPLSLIGQMGTKSVRRFSYCLSKLNSPTKSTFLRFGNDIKEKGNFQKTSFLSARNDYSVKLLNLSIGGRVLTLPRGTFSSGCVFDVGSGTTYLEMGAYNAVKNALIQHFDRFNLTRVGTDPSFPGDLCYLLQRGFRNYPGMVFHFQGANFEIGPEALFRFINDRFCLAVMGTQKRLTVLGAYQQQNVRFIYDIGNEKLLFAKEDCSQDKA